MKYFVLLFQAMIFNKYDYAHFVYVFEEAVSLLVDLLLMSTVYTSVIVSM